MAATPQPSSGNNILHIFSKDLRLHDNTALYFTKKQIEKARLENEEVKVGFVFFIDQEYLTKVLNYGKMRYAVLGSALEDLSRNLKRTNAELFVTYEPTARSLRYLANQFEIGRLLFNTNSEDKWLGFERCLFQGAPVDTYLSGFTGTTCNYNNIIRKNNSMVPLVHQDFVRLIKDDPEVLLKVKPAYDIILRNSEKLNIGENPAFERFCITKFRHCLDISMDVYKHLPKSCGETEGLRMHHKILTKCLTFPEISIFQSVGSLSPRLQLHSMRDEIDNIRSEFQDDEDFEINISATDQKRLDFYKEYLVKLLWREFFKCSSTYIKNYHQQEGNDICSQIRWSGPEVDKDYIKKVKSWTNGATGNPYVDACMRKLNETGLITHQERIAVANFLTNNLRISWEEGQRHFNKMLIDSDYALNAGNWMWAARCAYRSFEFNGDSTPSHSHKPSYFSEKFDPSAHLVKQWIPELEDVNSNYIHKPWTAPNEIKTRIAERIHDYADSIVSSSFLSEQSMDSTTTTGSEFIQWNKEAKKYRAAQKKQQKPRYSAFDEPVNEGSGVELHTTQKSMKLKGERKSTNYKTYSSAQFPIGGKSVNVRDHLSGLNPKIVVLEENEELKNSRHQYGLSDIPIGKLPPIINMNGIGANLIRPLFTEEADSRSGSPVNSRTHHELVRKQANPEDERAMFIDANFQGQGMQGGWLSSKMMRKTHPGTF